MGLPKQAEQLDLGTAVHDDFQPRTLRQPGRLVVAHAQLPHSTHAGDAVDGFALLAAIDGRLQDAAALLAFADTCFDEGAARDPIAEAAHSRVVTLVEQALRVGSIATSRARGTQLTIDEAAALALAREVRDRHTIPDPGIRS